MAKRKAEHSVKAALPAILSVLPADWSGTTFNNSNLLGRQEFASNLVKLVESKKGADAITTDELTGVGNAEDYLRVATNVSVTLELVLAQDNGYDVAHVFTFGSMHMPIVAVALASRQLVHVYAGDQPLPFSPEQIKHLAALGCAVQCHSGSPPADAPADAIFLSLGAPVSPEQAVVDGYLHDYTLFIAKPDKISPSEILVMRKRMATPLTTPMALARLQSIAGVPVTADIERADEASVAALYAHLQTLCGTPVNTSANPVLFTAGLPAISALWVSLMVTAGGADVLMCSTAYGGSSQLTDVVNSHSTVVRKHTFDVQEKGTSVHSAVALRLNELAAEPDKLLPTTVVFVEIPTNPDMKVPDLASLVASIAAYRTRVAKSVLLLVDATFAPGSQVLGQIRELDDTLDAMVFISLSKSVSRGITTGGTVIANHTPAMGALVNQVARTAAMLDTGARADQVLALTRHHCGVEERCQRAYHNAAAIGDRLCAAVKAATGATMLLAFVTPEQAARGYTTSTFSFNLPSPAQASPAINAGLAQRFVDQLALHATHFKPCVSFGQDNGLIYATVPATSTQGAIREEDKAKQAVGGVQLVRLSFPPAIATDAVAGIVEAAVASLYTPVC